MKPLSRTTSRGECPNRHKSDFLSTDGSEPSVKSKPYNGAFEIPLGTTVKALVTVAGKQALMMEERFAGDVGLVWENAGSDEGFGGEQAEDAEFVGATIATSGKNYNGSAFLDMGQKEGTYVEWYQENDGDTAQVELAIRYSGGSADRTVLRLNVNDQAQEKDLRLPKTGATGNRWKSYQTTISLKKGANTIRLTSLDNSGILVDEISIR